ncbi:MAG: response regulator transcription factor [Pseudomonadota bacterium]
MRIAVIEDNQALAQGIAFLLGDEGHAVDLHQDGAAGLAAILGDDPDAAILDINLPTLDGIEVLRRVRAAGHALPILLLTARSGVEDRIAGLDAGADDYLVKPFEMGELAARLRALLRRRADRAAPQLKIGDVTFDTTSRDVVAGDGTRLDIPRREAALFEALALAQGRLVSRERLLDHLYGVGADVDPAVIDSHVSRLRKRLAGTGAVIRTARGLGYLLEEGDG